METALVFLIVLAVYGGVPLALSFVVPRMTGWGNGRHGNERPVARGGRRPLTADGTAQS